MKHIYKIERLIFGLIFFVFGLNGFFQFIPAPTPPATAMPFLQGLGSSVYLFPLVFAIQTISGLALLSNRFVPLILILLAPIITNIVLYHIFLAPEFGMAITVLFLELHLAWNYRKSFSTILKAKEE